MISKISQSTSTSEQTLTSKDSQVHPNLVVGAVDIDRGLPVIFVQMRQSTLEKILLDGDSGVNLITEEEQIRLDLKDPSPAKYKLLMAD